MIRPTGVRRRDERVRRAGVVTRKKAPSSDRRPVESRVRAARMEKELSQAELAEAAGLTRQVVHAIESTHYLSNATTAARNPDWSVT